MSKQSLGTKLLKGIILTFLFVAGFSYFEPTLINHQQIWLMVIISVIASVFQPDYSPFKFAKDDNDKGTALQIIWCVYLSQVIILSEFVFSSYSPEPGWSAASMAGAVGAVVGLVIRSWAYFELGNYFTWHITVVDKQPVIDTGPYRWLAHPGYTGALLTYTATGVMLESWGAALCSMLFLFVVFRRRVRFEEKLLLDDIGEEYRLFLKQRYKLVPFIY